MSRTHHHDPSVLVILTISVAQTIFSTRYLVTPLIKRLLQLPLRLYQSKLRSETSPFKLYDLRLLDLWKFLATMRLTSKPKNTFTYCSSSSISLLETLLVALLAIQPTWIASCGIWWNPAALDVNLRAVWQKLLELMLSIPQFVTLIMVPRVALVVLDVFILHVFSTSVLTPFGGGQLLVKTVHSMIVVLSNVRKLVLSHQFLTALLFPSLGCVRTILEWLQSTYYLTRSTYPPSSLNVITKINFIKFS